jgi:hypothetical protein
VEERQIYNTIIKIKRDEKFATACCSWRSDKGNMSRGSLQQSTGENRSKEECSEKKIHPLLLDISVKVSSFLKEEDRESERERESRFYKALTGVHDAT